MLNAPENIVADVIKNQLGLADDQVVVRNQNYKLPNDDRLYIICGEVDTEIMSNTNYGVPTTGGMDQVQQVQARENIQIDVMSSTPEARQRRLEVVAALQSVYSEQAQELNSFRIFNIPRSFNNTSGAEGGSMLNRFTILISCFVWYRSQVGLIPTGGKYYNGDYYNQYPVEVINNTDNSVIEFTTE